MGNWQKGSRWQVVVSHCTLSCCVASQPPVEVTELCGKGASEHGNHPNGVRELRASEWTTDEEEATVGYTTYPDPTSNISIRPPTPNDELNGSDYLTAYPSPSPFIYDDINKLHRDYEDNIPEAIEYIRTMNQQSDECMVDDEDYQSYCQEMEERRYYTPSLSPPLVEQEAPPTT